MKTLKRNFLATCFLSCMLAVSAFAQQQRSEAEAQGKEDKTKIGITNFAIRPTAGAVFFENDTRFAGGALVDTNFLSTPAAKLGLATGIIYSNLDTAGGFFDGVGDKSRSIFQIPANLKVTVAPDPARRLQLGAHGGGNIVRSSADLGGDFGQNPTPAVAAAGGETSWDVHPNVGADIDYALSEHADLTLRPDLTFMSAFNMVTTTLALGIKL